VDRLTHHEVTVMFLSLGILLALALCLGEMAKRCRQPAVLGEILAGILLGPTVLGALAPEWSNVLFAVQGKNAVVLEGLTTLAIALFLLVAGMEVNLSTMWRQGKAALTVALAGIVAPFAVGFPASWSAPQLFGWEGEVDPLIFALFLATALSISALPVIARTLMDLNLYRSDFGMIIIAAAVCNDVVGWIVFAVILGLLVEGVRSGVSLGQTIGLTLGFAVVMLTAGRWLIHWILPWIKAHTAWPGGILGFALSLAFFGAAFTEYIGVHAIFGTFLIGVAIGDSSHLREQTRAVIHQFVSFIFAPLFFASIGLKVNFATHFDGILILTVCVVACLGKVVGCGVAARCSGMPPNEAWALGFGMNARGAMEIILGLLALQYGLIHERLFVALVVMALGTSMLSGPMIQRILGRSEPHRLIPYLRARGFVNPLRAYDRVAAIETLARVAAPVAGISSETIAEAVLAREQIMSTGLGNSVAAPHARIEGLKAPVVAVGLSTPGIDFDALDGKPAQIIFLLLTPENDGGAQLDLLADIEQTFSKPEVREQALKVQSFIEFLALLKSETSS